jgi:4-amino-4-deoxy-L-arabinose transferase-like glycosyltransferase
MRCAIIIVSVLILAGCTRYQPLPLFPDKLRVRAYLVKLGGQFFARRCQRWLLPGFTVLTFFLLLGSRALNEPDEGRYTEIAREMVETGDWLVPHFWYLPHLDKPPMTYWLVAVSLKLFGQNEWAARLPAALAGISGVGATFLLGCSCGGRRTGFWAALILQTSLLYFGMARMLTTDIFLMQFIAWAIYFFWRSWLCPFAEHGKSCAWHMAGWGAMGLGFLVKGPIALAVPLAALAALAIWRRREGGGKRIPAAGLAGGAVLFFIMVLPWFLAVFQRLPAAAHFMILGQAVGHFMGTTIKNRRGSPFYFFAILAIGLLPWTFLLGWLWRRAHWRGLNAEAKDAWVLLNVWAIFTFTLFSLSHAKLPAYILPIFPALAVLLALRFFGDAGAPEASPKVIWQLCLLGSLALPALFPLLAAFVFHNALPAWLKWQTPVVATIAVLIFWRARHWKWHTRTACTIGLMSVGLAIVVAEIPAFETSFRANQTLKPLGRELRANFRPGDVVVCWGVLPQGFLFYAGLAISATNRPYFGGMDLTQVPFRFPGNRKRMGDLLLPDEHALAKLLDGPRRVWVLSHGNDLEKVPGNRAGSSSYLILSSGQWKLFSNAPNVGAFASIHD